MSTADGRAIDPRAAEVLDFWFGRPGEAHYLQTREQWFRKDKAFDALFSGLDKLEARLEGARYLVGEQITEADWRLFTTLVRFDAVYYVHFKCNLRRIAEYPALSRFLRELCRVPGIAETVNMDHIKRHYYLSHRHLNPSGIVPKGPVLDFLPSG